MSNGAKSDTTSGYELPAISSVGATNQVLTAGASSSQSAAFQKTTSVVRVYSESDFWLEQGADPVAANTSIFCPGTIVHYFGVRPESKIAVLRTGSSNSTVYLMEGGV